MPMGSEVTTHLFSLFVLYNFVVGYQMMSTHSFDSSDGWDTMEDANMVITDVGVLSKKEKAGADYTVVRLAKV